MPTEEIAQQTCPVLHYKDAVSERGLFETYEHFDQLRESAPIYKSDFADFWVFTRDEHIREAMGNPEVFSNSSVIPFDPDPSYRWVPENLDPPHHAEWRRRMAPYFSPAAVAEMRDTIRSRCISFIEDIKDKGECDYLEDFAFKFPTTVLLDMLDLPQSDTAQFLAWEDATVRAPNWTDTSTVEAAVGEILAYMGEVLKERRKNPGDDIISHAITWDIDGAPAPEDDLLSFCMLLFMAGLDTVATQLTLSTLHFATHPEDQAKIRANPGLAPTAVEEMMRLYSIVAPARKITQDTEFHGVQLRRGEMVWLPLWHANRDPRMREDPTDPRLDARNNNHLGFGHGVHRCVGAHLAREEMRTAFVEWHRLVPEYRLDESRPIKQRISSNMTLDHAPLLWNV